MSSRIALTYKIEFLFVQPEKAMSYPIKNQYPMAIANRLFLFVLLLFILSYSNGCASLPDVSEKIDEASTAQKPRQIVSSTGLLSPQKSKAIMDRLKQSVDPTDI